MCKTKCAIPLATLSLILISNGQIVPRFVANEAQASETVAGSIANEAKPRASQGLVPKDPVDLSSGDSGFSFVTFSPDSRTMAYGLARGPILQREYATVLWDVATKKKTGRLEGPVSHWPGAVVFSPDGKTVAIACFDSTIRLWDLETQEQLHEFEQSRWAGDGFAISMNGNILAGKTATASGHHIHIWDAASGKRLCHFGGDSHGWVGAFSLSGDGRYLVAVHSKGSGPARGAKRREMTTRTLAAHLWDVRTGEHLGQVGEPTEWTGTSGGAPEMQGKLSQVGLDEHGFRVRVSPGGAKLMVFPSYRRNAAVALSTHGHTFRLVEKTTANELGTFREFANGCLRSVATSPDGKTIAAIGQLDTVTLDSKLLVWDISNLIPPPRNPRTRLTAEELGTLWKDLANLTPSVPLKAMSTLMQHPSQTLDFLNEHLKPTPVREQKRITQLLAELHDADTAVQNRAEQELIERSDEVAPSTLRTALDTSSSTHARQRMQRILDQLKPGLIQLDTRKALWGIEILEQLATPEARQLLEKVAQGAPNAWLTLEAKASLDRLGKCDAGAP